MQRVLRQLLDGRGLDEAEAQRAFRLILTGEANESQVGAMLALIAHRGPTIDEIVGGAREMRAHAVPIPIDPALLRGPLIDTCGTGGAPKTFNISTVSAVVAAAARAPGGERVHVAKHGGRSRSGRGSAEVLAALGVNIDAAPVTQARCLHEAGVCFSFAVNHHPAMRFAAGPRKSLGFPTIFNALGPLCNPAGAPRQVMGVYDRALVDLIARALHRLGARRAMVVHADDGMDELSTAAPALIALVDPSGVRTERFDPRAMGIEPPPPGALAAGSLEDAAEAALRILAGEPGPRRDIVLINTGAALTVGGLAEGIAQGAALAAEAIDSGRAAETLRRLADLSNEPPGTP